MGRHLLGMGYKPGPEFKVMIQNCFEAQLDEKFADHEGAIRCFREHVENVR